MIFRSGRQEPGLEGARVAELDGRKESGHYILRLSDERVGLPQENLESEARSDCSMCLRLTLQAC